MRLETRSTIGSEKCSPNYLSDPATWQFIARSVLIIKTLFHVIAGAMHVCEASDTGRYQATIVVGAVELCLVIGAAALYFSVSDASVQSGGDKYLTSSQTWRKPVANSIAFGYMFTLGDLLSLFLPFLFNGSRASAFAAVWTAVNANVINFSSSLVMLSPLMVVTLAPCIPVVHLFVLWVSCIAALIVATLLSGDVASLFTVGNYVVCSAFLLCALTRNRGIECSTLHAALDNERLDLEEHMHQEYESKMRQMVANVAHDLKTPLSSFMVGVENIRSEVEDLEHVLSAALPQLPQKLIASLSATKMCLSTMTNTNQFMLMSIHRVLDYAKASKGLKLIPKYETVDLKEALQLPLTCMTDLQQRIAIRFLPLPAVICSHIITDKQWLQENVLCLLSNAVKYSSEGLVLLSVTLSPATSTSEDSFARRTSLAWTPRVGNKAKRFQPPSNQPSQSTFRTDGTSGDSMHIRSDEHTPSSLSNGPNRETSRCLRIEVIDAGIGMSEEAMQALFSPFQQTQRLAGGTGLGLFSLARRVEALHGRCGVEQRRDGRQGSLFWFEIPYRPDSVLEAQRKGGETEEGSIGEGSHVIKMSTPRGEHSGEGDGIVAAFNDSDSECEVIAPEVFTHVVQPQKPVVATSGRRILLVDDSPSVLRLTAMQLRKAGFEVTTAENGALALAALQARHRSGPSPQASPLTPRREQGQSKDEAWQCEEKVEPAFDVVLMDLQMPVMDGLEAVKRLRQWENSLLVLSTPSSSRSHPDSSASIHESVSTDADLDQVPLQLPIQLPVHVKPQPARQLSRSPSSGTDSRGVPEGSTSSSPRGMRLSSPMLVSMPSYKTACTVEDFASPALPSPSTSMYSNRAEPLPGVHHIVIGLSANSDGDTLDASITAGFDGFLSKPFTMDAFTDLLRQLS